MNHVMLDIETLGDESCSIITSIGAVQFDIATGKTGKEFHKYIDIQSSFNRGLKMNPSTILWWMKQTDDARHNLIKGNDKGLDVVTALSEFSEWLTWLKRSDVTTGSRLTYMSNEIYMWGRGPRFDMGILADAYRATKLEIPWDTRKELCVRTMEFLNPQIKKKTGLVDVGHGSDGMGIHDAVLDCKYQIAYVCRIYKQQNR